MAKRSIQNQIEDVIALLEHARDAGKIDPDCEDGAESAIKTLTWVRDKTDVIKLAVTILKDDRVKAVQDAFPGSEIAHARQIRTIADETDDETGTFESF